MFCFAAAGDARVCSMLKKGGYVFLGNKKLFKDHHC